MCISHSSSLRPSPAVQADEMSLREESGARNYSLRMVRKTRDKFIEVARQLFAHKGVENTTMNDIASASDKGRRTIYTYFKSKREIFNAVIESETEQLLEKLRVIVNRDESPEQKLREYVACRFETMKEIVRRNGSLRAGFFRDVRKVDRARRIVTDREMQLLCSILREGVENGAFHIANIHDTAVVITMAIQGFDVSYIRDELNDKGLDKYRLIDCLNHLILDGITHRD